MVLLRLLPDRFAICRFGPREETPTWVDSAGGGFASVTRSEHELSVICRESAVSAVGEFPADRGWRALRAVGPFAFDVVGVLASLAAPLATAGVPIFAISTYETDYLLVKHTDLSAALAALRGAGHSFEGD